MNTTHDATHRAVIYCRVSSDDNDHSTGDQEALLRDLCERRGWPVVGAFRDDGISGAVKDRPGLLAAKAAVLDGEATILVAEAADRLHRDLGDLAELYREVDYADAKIVTSSEGELTLMHVGMGGVLGQLYLKMVADKTHRGLSARAKEGRPVTGASYGYRIVTEGDRKRLEIDPEKAPTVRWLFAKFVEGWSPKALAADLNERRVPSARNGTWAGSAVRAMLLNPLYTGELVWNKARSRRDPKTRQRRFVARPESEWIRHHDPALRIVDDATWKAAQARFSEHPQHANPGPTGNAKKYLLSGLLRCGCCGRNLIIIDRMNYGCSSYVNRGKAVCDNRHRVRRSVVEDRVLAAIKVDLFTDEAVALFKREVTRLLKERAVTVDDRKANARSRLATVEKDLERLLAAIKAGVDATLIKDEVNRLSAERDALRSSLRSETRPLDKAVAMLPRAIDRYRTLVGDLPNALSRDVARARADLKHLLGTIRVMPTAEGPMAEVTGDYAGLFRLADVKFDGCGGRI